MVKASFQEDMPDSYSKYSILVWDKQGPVAQLSSLGTRESYVGLG